VLSSLGSRVGSHPALSVVSSVSRRGVSMKERSVGSVVVPPSILECYLSVVPESMVSGIRLLIPRRFFRVL